MKRPPDFEAWKPGMTPQEEDALWDRNMAAMERMEEAARKLAARRKREQKGGSP